MKLLSITVKEFIRLESASGIILIFAAILAMITANSPLSGFYDLLLDIPVEIRIGGLHIAKPLLLWINDGLMAVFFFLIGLELKRETIEGELSDPEKFKLPAIGAAGGMVIPALIYAYINWDDAVALKGWAIPAATDIAFALGILSLLGNRVPTTLKVFLVSLAIFDDIGAIIIIAVFYSGDLSLSALIIAILCMIAAAIVNRRHVTTFTPYLMIGIVMWIALLKSGVHATLAGILLALFIPMHDPEQKERSPLKELEHDLHTAVAFFILPIFAFANSGIALSGVGWGHLFHPVTLGITTGLFVGKQIGIFGFCWLGMKLGIIKLPPEISLGSLYGVALLCGVGFTMSLFIGSLAFESTGENLLFDERLGIIIGSILSATAAYIVLSLSLKTPDIDNKESL